MFYRFVKHVGRLLLRCKSATGKRHYCVELIHRMSQEVRRFLSHKTLLASRPLFMNQCNIKHRYVQVAVVEVTTLLFNFFLLASTKRFRTVEELTLGDKTEPHYSVMGKDAFAHAHGPNSRLSQYSGVYDHRAPYCFANVNVSCISEVKQWNANPFNDFSITRHAKWWIVKRVAKVKVLHLNTLNSFSEGVFFNIGNKWNFLETSNPILTLHVNAVTAFAFTERFPFIFMSVCHVGSLKFIKAHFVRKMAKNTTCHSIGKPLKQHAYAKTRCKFPLVVKYETKQFCFTVMTALIGSSFLFALSRHPVFF